MPVSDDQNSLKAGGRGPTLLEDQHFREKIFHFDHERIPERVVHARGFGAHGADATLLAALIEAAEQEGASVELIAPTVGGITDSDGKPLEVQQKVNGGPSVLYDAIALVVSAGGAALLAREATAKDFVSDAFAHAKFIAYAETARPLLEKAGVTPDDGVIALKAATDAAAFIARCRELRLWQREDSVHAV